MNDLVFQLMEVYYNEETGWETHLTPKEAEKYFKNLIKKDRILAITSTRDTDNGMLEAYCEFWTINAEQLRKAISETERFYPETEDINSGEICHIFCLWVRKDLRKAEHIRRIRRMIIDKCPHIEYFTGQELKNNRRFRYHRIRR